MITVKSDRSVKARNSFLNVFMVAQYRAEIVMVFSNLWCERKSLFESLLCSGQLGRRQVRDTQVRITRGDSLHPLSGAIEATSLLQSAFVRSCARLDRAANSPGRSFSAILALAIASSVA